MFEYCWSRPTSVGDPLGLHPGLGLWLGAMIDYCKKLRDKIRDAESALAAADERVVAANAALIAAEDAYNTANAAAQAVVDDLEAREANARGKRGNLDENFAKMLEQAGAARLAIQQNGWGRVVAAQDEVRVAKNEADAAREKVGSLKSEYEKKCAGLAQALSDAWVRQEAVILQENAESAARGGELAPSPRPAAPRPPQDPFAPPAHTPRRR